MTGTAPSGALDAAIVGAGFAGMYTIHKLRTAGSRVRAFEAGDGVGGTWYWNRYPGARCDFESVEYSYSFSKELQQEWRWSERYAAQAEFLRYANHFADRFGLRDAISFDTRVTRGEFDDAPRLWIIETDRGEAVQARFLITAGGCLSQRRMPDFPGRDSFQGKLCHTGTWPHEAVGFSEQRVGVIRTGSLGIQVIPQFARQARCDRVRDRLRRGHRRGAQHRHPGQGRQQHGGQVDGLGRASAFPGKPRVFLPYIGGQGNYSIKCAEVAAGTYEGSVLAD